MHGVRLLLNHVRAMVLRLRIKDNESEHFYSIQQFHTEEINISNQ